MTLKQPIFLEQNIKAPFMSPSDLALLNSDIDIYDKYIGKTFSDFSDTDKEYYEDTLAVLRAICDISETKETEAAQLHKNVPDYEMHVFSSQDPFIEPLNHTRIKQCAERITKYTPDYNSDEWYALKRIGELLTKLVIINSIIANPVKMSDVLNASKTQPVETTGSEENDEDTKETQLLRELIQSRTCPLSSPTERFFKELAFSISQIPAIYFICLFIACFFGNYSFTISDLIFPTIAFIFYFITKAVAKILEAVRESKYDNEHKDGGKNTNNKQ